VAVCSVAFVGIFFACEALGTVVSYIGGGFLLQLYTHFDTVDVSTSVYNVYLLAVFIIQDFISGGGV